MEARRLHKKYRSELELYRVIFSGEDRVVPSLYMNKQGGLGIRMPDRMLVGT